MDNPYLFQTVKSVVDIMDVARHCGLEPDRKGWCRCPFHGEKTASFHLYNQRYRCFGCGASGDAIDLIAGVRELDPLEAVKELNAVLGLGIDLDAPVDTTALAKARAEREKRERFKRWREGIIRDLTACFYTMWQTILRSEDTPASGVTEEHGKALKYLSVVEYYLDLICYGDEADIKENRKNFEKILQKLKEVKMGEKR